MSDEVVGIAAANDAAAAAFTAGLQALQAPPPPAAPAVEATPTAEAAPLATPEPPPADPLAPPVDPVAPATPVEAAPATPPATPPAPAPTELDFASADIVAAGAKIGLSPEDIQRLYRSTPAEQRATLLQRLGAAPAPDPEPAPLDPSTLDRELQTYLTSQHPDGSRLFADYRAHTERLTALAPELAAAETALRDAEALVRITSREGVDEMERADAAATRRDASLRLQELRMEAAERKAERTRLDLEYRNLFSTTRSRVLADHDAKLAERRAAAEREAQISSYAKQWSAETDAAVDATFSSLGLDPAFKGTRPAAGSQPDLSFWSYVHSALTNATLRGSIQDVRAFVSGLGPEYAKHVQSVNRIQAAAYGRLAQQRSSVPGPAPGVSAVASPEASPSFNGDLRALDEIASARFTNALRGLPS